MRLAGLLLILAPSLGFAAQTSETFSSRATLDTGTAVWNQFLGMVHPTLEINNYEAAAVPPIPVDVGDGSDGVFDPTTYANFSVGGVTPGNVITIDTDVHPVLKFTNFILEDPWKIIPVGSKPLIIYSLGDVIIRGEIHCQGGNGTAAAGATPGTGGTGRCGGKNGGDGGAVGGAGQSGVDASGAVTGGEGGAFSGGLATGGGGGGSWNTQSGSSMTAGDGVNSSALSGGRGGSNFSDPEFTTLLGAAGGGGGSGDAGAAGGGGGAGGGLVVIHTVRDFILGDPLDTTIGYIYANGGDGGAGAASGGGGGGGGVFVVAGGAIEIYNTDAASASQANVGSPLGTSGGLGRSWFVSQSWKPAGSLGSYTPSEDPPVDTSTAIVQFSAAAQEVVTRTVDLGSTILDLQNLATVPVSADFQIFLRGSTDNFAADDTGWTTTLSDLVGKRYVKIRAVITTSNVNTPTMLSEVSFDTTLADAETSFRMKAAGCGRVDASVPPPSSGSISLALLCLLLPLAVWSVLGRAGGCSWSQSRRPRLGRSIL
jgi:hypothetical protein